MVRKHAAVAWSAFGLCLSTCFRASLDETRKIKDKTNITLPWGASCAAGVRGCGAGIARAPWFKCKGDPFFVESQRKQWPKRIGSEG